MIGLEQFLKHNLGLVRWVWTVKSILPWACGTVGFRFISGYQISSLTYFSFLAAAILKLIAATRDFPVFIQEVLHLILLLKPYQCYRDFHSSELNSRWNLMIKLIIKYYSILKLVVIDSLQFVGNLLKVQNISFSFHQSSRFAVDLQCCW